MPRMAMMSLQGFVALKATTPAHVAGDVIVLLQPMMQRVPIRREVEPSGSTAGNRCPFSEIRQNVENRRRVRGARNDVAGAQGRSRSSAEQKPPERDVIGLTCGRNRSCIRTHAVASVG